MFTQSNQRYSRAMISLFDNIVKTELNNILNNYEIGSQTTTSYSELKLVDGNVLAPIAPNKQSIQELITNAKVRFGMDFTQEQFKDNKNIRHCGGEFINNMKGTILTIDKKMTVQEALDYALPFIQKAGSNFYGMVLKNGNTLINPLHPLYAISHIEYSLNSTTKYNVILYFYPNRAELDKKYFTHTANKELITENLNNLLRAYSSEAVATALCTHKEISTNNRSINLEFREKVKFTSYDALKATATGYQYYLSAQQVLTRGIYFPYYGSSLIRKTKEGDGEGMSLTPFLAVNIGSPTTTAYAQNQNHTFTSVCTGGQPRNTLEGLRVLTHANLSSAMNSSCILSGALAYADMAINLSLTLYHKAGLIKELVQIPCNWEPKSALDPEIVALYLLDKDKFTINLKAHFDNISAKDGLAIYKQLKALDEKGELDDNSKTTKDN